MVHFPDTSHNAKSLSSQPLLMLEQIESKAFNVTIASRQLYLPRLDKLEAIRHVRIGVVNNSKFKN